MNYEQKYKEALKVIESLYNVVRYQSSSDALLASQTIEKAFPELKESEDEKNIKNLVEELKCSLRAANCQNDATKGGHEKRIALLEWGIAWLEKQGEQKPAEYALKDAADIFLDALSKTPYNNKPITDAQIITRELLKFLTDTYSYNPNAINEQKPAWSEEDERIRYCIIRDQEKALDDVRKDKYGHSEIISDLKEMYRERIDWLKSLKDRVQPKPKQEWNVQDEAFLGDAIYAAKNTYSEKCGQEELIEWLKSFKPHNWKPSEEQMEHLNRCFTGRILPDADVLESLYNDLEKL